MYNTVISKCVLILNLQLGTPGEFVKIAKDARKRPFAAHVWFSDICDSFTATILLGGVDFWGFFFTWEVLNNCFFINFIACGEQKSKKKILKNEIFLFPWAIIDFFHFTKMLKALPLFIWNYSGKSFPKLAWDGKARFSAISSLSCAPLNCYLKQDLSQPLLSANGVTPCKHSLFAWTSGLPEDDVYIGTDRTHVCTHTKFFNVLMYIVGSKKWKISDLEFLHYSWIRVEWIFIVWELAILQMG